MVLKTLKKRFVSSFAPWFIYWGVKILSSTMRFQEIHPEIPNEFWDKGIPAIWAFWHGRLLMMPVLHKKAKLSFLVSPHRDGQMLGKALKRFGFYAIAGSTFRKGFSSFKKMVKADGSDIAIVPDGPRGPRYRVQIGAIGLAKLTGRAVVPLTFNASRRKIFNTWDQFLIPYPFSKGVFIWGEAIYVDPHGNRAHLEEKRILLENRLNELTERADHFFEPEKI